MAKKFCAENDTHLHYVPKALFELDSTLALTSNVPFFVSVSNSEEYYYSENEHLIPCIF